MPQELDAVENEDAGTEEASSEDIFAEFAAKHEGSEESVEDPDAEEGAGEFLTDEEKAELEKEGLEEGEKSGETSQAKPDGKDEEEDPLADVPDAVKSIITANQAEIDRLNHKIKSDDGRVSALQKKINKIQTESKSDAISPKEFAEAFTSKESWTTFAEENPELAETMGDFMKGFAENAQANLDEANEKTDALTELSEVEAQKSAEDEVGAVYPEWQNWISSDEFSSWLTTKPAALQEILEDGSVEDSIWLLGQYKDNLISTGKLKTPPPAEVKPSKVAKIKAKRTKQLEDGTQTKSQGGSATPISEKDTTSLFDYFVDKRKKAS